MRQHYPFFLSGRPWWLYLAVLLCSPAVLVAQTITGFTPSSGLPGTAVTVTGTNLAGVTGLAFNGVPTAGITSVSNTSLTVYVPVRATSGPLRATSPSGSGTSAASFTVTPAKPDLTVAVTPAGPVSACGGPTLTAVASTKPFALAGSGLVGYPDVTVLQPDGKILVAGNIDSYNGTTRGGILRLNADGSLDTSFAPTGSGIDYDILAMVLQPDGKILIGGQFTTYNGASCRYLTRLNANGTRDASFNLVGTGLNNAVRTLALQPDGKIVVGGYFSNYNSTIRNVLLRLNADGSLDTSFVLPGTGIVGTLWTLAVQPDGRILVGGSIDRFNGVANAGSLVRLYPNGSFDSSFRMAPMSGSTVLQLALQPDNKILASGAIYGPNGRQQSIARLNTDGSLDYSFSPTGSGLNSAVQQMAVQPDGKIRVVGNFNEYNGIVHNYTARLNADGTLDNSYTATGTGPSYAIQDMALQPDGKAVMVGSFGSYNGSGTGKIIRLNADGTLDATLTPAANVTYSWSPTGTAGATVVPTAAGGSYQAVATVNGNIFLSNSVTVTSCLNAPVVNGFSPASGPVGTVLTINGANLSGTTSITFAGTTSTTVTSGFVVTGGTQITGVVVPAGAQSGLFSVTTSGGTGSSPSSFTVTTPTISGLSPASVLVGSGGFTLTVSGSDFVRGAVVSFNNVSLPTTYVSATQLTATVPASAVATAGSYPVRVANSAVSGNSTSVATAFAVLVPAPTITSFTPVSGQAGTAVTITGTNLTGATALTLNGAAITSFAVASATTLIFTVPAGATSGFISVTTPGGTALSTGTFTVGSALAITAVSPAPNVRTAARTSAVQITFNQALAGSSATALRVHSTQRGGLRTAATPATVAGSTLTYTPSATQPFAPGETVRATVTTAAAGLAGNALARARVLQFTTAVGGTGTGNFATTYDATVQATGAAPGCPILGDVDGDGDLDLLTANNNYNGTVSVRLNNGSGTFTGSQNVAVGNLPEEIALADVDGDGDLDLLAVNDLAGGGTVSVRFNNGSGTFSGSQEITVGRGPHGCVVGDLDGDGDLDFSLVNEFSNTVSVCLNNGAGIFTAAPGVPTVNSPRTIITGDIDGDGDLDLLTSGIGGTAVGVLLNDGAAAFSNGASLSVGVYPYRLALGDVDGDGDLDLLAANNNVYRAGTVSVRLNTGTGTFTSLADVAVGVGPLDLKLADVDNDGDLDLLVANYGEPTGTAGTTVSVRLNRGAGSFSAPATNAELTVGAKPNSLTLGDIDGDGDLDLLTANNTSLVNVRLNGAALVPPTIASFTPASGAPGTSVTVTGTNFTGATAVTLNGVAVPSYTVNSAASLVFSVPANGTSGVIAITTPGGTATSSTAFTVLNPTPVLYSISPNRVLVNSGSFTLTVNGMGFVAGSVINFLGGPVATTFVSGTQLTAVIANSYLTSISSSYVTVTNPAPGGGTSMGQLFETYLPAPTITSFTPASGPVGTTITVTGTNFQLVKYVGLASVGSPYATSVTVVSPTTLTFVVPTGSVSGPVGVSTSGGTEYSTDSFIVTATPSPVPTLTSLSPTTTVAGSNAFALVVSGTNFTTSSLVNFNGLPLATTYASATQLTAQVPASAVATAGAFGVTVTTPAPGGGTSAAATFTVTAPVPTFVSFTPASGLVGATITVTGTNLTGATTLTLNGVSVGSFAVVNATTLTFVVPAGATSGLVAVTTPGGTATSASAFTVLQPNPVPTLASLSPSTVVAGSPAFTLTLNGTGFIAGSVVNLAGADLPTTYVSATQLTVAVPASAVAVAGSYGVTVASPAPGGGTSGTLTLVVTTPAPSITSFSPLSGPVGTAVTVVGTNFSGAIAVTLNGAAVGSFTVASATTISFVVPAGAASGFIAVTTPGGTATSGAAFTVINPNPVPTITSLSPASAVAGSGALTLVITGTGFLSNSVVSFAGISLPTTYASATQLTAQVSASLLTTMGSYNVLVTNPTPGGGASVTAVFTVTAPAPALLSFTPASGLVGATITVMGTNLTGATTLTLNGVSVGSFAVVNATTLTFVVPAGATSGLVAVTTPGGTATSASAFTVLQPNPVPTLASLSPSTVVAGSPAFTLTLSGTGFITGSVVRFNATALATTYVSATQLTAVLPASALATAGSYEVLVSNATPGGGSSAALPFVVTVPAPTISSFTPTAGGSGTLLTITGTNLTGATEVHIGTTLIPTFTVVSATSLTLVVPANSGVVSGFITVTTPGGTATSATAFGGVLATAGSQALPELQVYPNPFKSKLTIVLPGSGVAQVSLYDVAGRLVLPLAPLPATGQLQLPDDLATGVYLLEVRQGTAIMRRSLVKQ